MYSMYSLLCCQVIKAVEPVHRLFKTTGYIPARTSLVFWCLSKECLYLQEWHVLRLLQRWLPNPGDYQRIRTFVQSKMSAGNKKEIKTTDVRYLKFHVKLTYCSYLTNVMYSIYAVLQDNDYSSEGEKIQRVKQKRKQW